MKKFSIICFCLLVLFLCFLYVNLTSCTKKTSQQKIASVDTKQVFDAKQTLFPVVKEEQEYQLYFCENRHEDDGLPVRNIYHKLNHSYVFNPEHCVYPRIIIKPNEPSRPRIKQRYENIKPMILDWNENRIYGDIFPIGGDGIVDTDDILTILWAFESQNQMNQCNNFQCTPMDWWIGIDIHPCGGGDGLIDLDDILAISAAFQGFQYCQGL